MRTLVRDSGGVEKHRSDGGSAELHIARNSAQKLGWRMVPIVLDDDDDSSDPPEPEDRDDDE